MKVNSMFCKTSFRRVTFGYGAVMVVRSTTELRAPECHIAGGRCRGFVRSLVCRQGSGYSDVEEISAKAAPSGRAARPAAKKPVKEQPKSEEEEEEEDEAAPGGLAAGSSEEDDAPSVAAVGRGRGAKARGQPPKKRSASEPSTFRGAASAPLKKQRGKACCVKCLKSEKDSHSRVQLFLRKFDILI